MATVAAALTLAALSEAVCLRTTTHRSPANPSGSATIAAITIQLAKRWNRSVSAPRSGREHVERERDREGDQRAAHRVHGEGVQLGCVASTFDDAMACRGEHDERDHDEQQDQADEVQRLLQGRKLRERRLEERPVLEPEQHLR